MWTDECQRHALICGHWRPVGFCHGYNVNPSRRNIWREEYLDRQEDRRTLQEVFLADGINCGATLHEADGYLKWILLKISVLAGFSGTEGGATRMEASKGTLAGGRQA